MTEINNAHKEIVNHLVNAAASSTLQASEDIYDTAGNKLLSKGYVITPDIQNRLMEKALKRPIEASVQSDKAVSNKEIASRAEVLIQNSPLIKALIEDHAKEVKALTHITLDPLAATLLTVMRDAEGGMLNHAIFVTLLARSIATKMQFSHVDMHNLTLSGLLHDVGELYINVPKVGVLTKSDWRKVMLHPKLGSNIVKREMQYPNAVSLAILEHHERNDGTGYPNNQHADDCSMNGQVLMLAEAIAGILKAGVDAQNVIVAIKAQQEIYPSKPLNVLMTMLKSMPNVRAEVDKHSTLERLKNKMAAIDFAESRLINLQGDKTMPMAIRSVAQYMRARVHKSKQRVYASGLHFYLEDDAWEDLSEDHFLILELEVLTNELGWQIQDLLRDVTLQLVSFKESLPVPFAEVTEELAQIYVKRNARTREHA